MFVSLRFKPIQIHVHQHTRYNKSSLFQRRFSKASFLQSSFPHLLEVVLEFSHSHIELIDIFISHIQVIFSLHSNQGCNPVLCPTRKKLEIKNFD